MAASSSSSSAFLYSADSPPLKRSFTDDIVSNTAYRGPRRVSESCFAGVGSCPNNTTLRPVKRPARPAAQRRRGVKDAEHAAAAATTTTTPNRASSMPISTTTRPHAVLMPSFMSVFGEEANTRAFREYRDRKAASHGESIRPATSGNIQRGPGPGLGPFSSSSATSTSFHQHRNSTSTSGSESTDTSPTSTISTVDSSTMTEPSPGPPPESPQAKTPATSFSPDFRSRQRSIEASPSQYFELQRPTTPAKKPRNLKNLAVNTSSAVSFGGRLISTAVLPAGNGDGRPPTTSSAPSSPSFVKPPTPPRRRPSNLGLTIQTPANSNLPTRLTIPATPSFKQRPSLRHFQSSPSLPLCSPTVAPSGGMQFPPPKQQKPAPHGFAEVPLEDDEEEDQEPNFDVPQSREEKPAAYPNGPICIYESGVYLYFEPTAEQACDYDVILNVASEVKNPFLSSTEEGQKFDLDARRAGADQPKGLHGVTPQDFMRASAAAAGKEQSNSPTTPKASYQDHLPLNTTVIPPRDGKPEYIHIPWEHNTDIVPDLFKLVRLIDNRVQQGKRVLVHCQCGVSRSASLIVAFGLYKNPGISVQEAYDAVKRRSKWIGPNMNLIMQLQEFRNGLLRANNDRGFSNQVYGLSQHSAGLAASSVTGARRTAPFGDATSGSRTPRTAPLPPEVDASAQRASTGNMISPGPLSAPFLTGPGFRRSWGSPQPEFDLSPTTTAPTASTPVAVTTETPYVDPKGHVVPMIEVVPKVDDTPRPPPPPPPPQQQQKTPCSRSSPAERRKTAAMHFARQLPFRQDHDGDLHMSGTTVTTQTVASPRSEEFHMNGFQARDEESRDGCGLMSPRRATFDIPPASRASPPRLEEPPLFSPMRMEFDREGWGERRRDEEDSYGLTSPRATEFPRDPLATLEQSIASEVHRQPSSPKHAHVILPPSDLGSSSLEGFGGFGSLDERARPAEHGGSSGAFPSISVHDSPSRRMDSHDGFLPPPSPGFFPPSNGFDRFARPPPPSPGFFHRPDSLQPPFAQSVDRTLPPPSPSFFSPPSTSNHHHNHHPPSPPRDPQLQPQPLRPKFSAPNLREQIRLHRLQAELEAQLPHRSPSLHPVGGGHGGGGGDDVPVPVPVPEDALLSPRATEFVRNPFHVDLGRVVAEAGGEGEGMGVKREQEEEEKKEGKEVLQEDPRSPVQKGSAAGLIVRNIWDVL